MPDWVGRRLTVAKANDSKFSAFQAQKAKGKDGKRKTESAKRKLIYKGPVKEILQADSAEVEAADTDSQVATKE